MTTAARPPEANAAPAPFDLFGAEHDDPAAGYLLVMPTDSAEYARGTLPGSLCCSLCHRPIRPGKVYLFQPRRARRIHVPVCMNRESATEAQPR
jgi:hypothetical protein